MNVFCQTDAALPKDGDIPVWSAAGARWTFRASGATPPGPVDPEQPTDPEQPINPEQPEESVIAYEIGEWKDWYRAAPLPKWKVRNGELLTDVSTNYPELLAYLRLPENTWMLKDEPEWQELSRAAGGIGGVWYYSLDEGADTIRLPDTRGDFSRDAGGRKGDGANDGVYGVGEWHGDAIRNIEGEIWNQGSPSAPTVGFLWSGTGDIGQGNGALTSSQREGCAVAEFRTDNAGRGIAFDASRAVPTAHENRPRAGMLLGCVYVGR